MSLFPGAARNGVSALTGLRSTPTAMLRRSFTPLAAIGTQANRAQKPVSSQLSQQPIVQAKPVTPASMATQMLVRPFVHSAARAAPITTYTQDEALKMLNEQRSLRPNSPHFTIYQPQATWYLSILTRITGVGLSAVFYVWAISYLAIPYTGAGQVMSSAHLVQYAAMAPEWLKVAIKAPVAFAFSFHSFNGVRHLLWDVGYGLSMKGVYMGAYIVLGASVAATVALCML